MKKGVIDYDRALAEVQALLDELNADLARVRMYKGRWTDDRLRARQGLLARRGQLRTWKAGQVLAN